MLTFFRKGLFLPSVLFFFISIIYTFYISLSVYGGDVGDLVSAISVKGVAHPPGYPLFTMLGILTFYLPIAATPAFKVGLISAIFSSLTIVILFLVIKKFGGKNLLALLGSLTLAFFYQFWLYAEIAEVFALNTFFAALLFYLWLCFSITSKKIYFYLGTFVLGLSLSHHHTIVLIFPALFLLFIKGMRGSGRLGKLGKLGVLGVLLRGTLLLLVGLLPYLYVPIAASHNPPINWDNATNLQNFIRLVLRQDYGSFSAGGFVPPSLEQRFIELKGYFISVFTGFTIAGSILIFLGSYYFVKNKRFYFFVLITAYLISGPLFIFYAGFPIKSTFILGIYERFFILSTFFLAIFLPFGANILLNPLVRFVQNKELKKLAGYSLLLFFIIPFSLFRFNNQKTNLSSIWIGDNLGYDYLAHNPQNSVVFLSGDTELFNTQYMHYARSVRSDEVIINMNNVGTSNFFNTEYKKVLKKHKEFKEGESDGVLATIVEIAKERPVFSMAELQYTDKKKNRLVWVPKGLLKELYVNKVLPTKDEYSKEVETIQNKLLVPFVTKENALKLGNLTIADIKRNYANAALATGSFYISEYQDDEKAFSWYKKALTIDPNYNTTYKVIGSYYFEEKKDCKKAAEYFGKSINVDRSDRLSFFLLYNVVKTCLKDERQAENIAKSFRENFGVEFLTAIQKIIKDYESLNK